MMYNTLLSTPHSLLQCMVLAYHNTHNRALTEGCQLICKICQHLILDPRCSQTMN